MPIQPLTKIALLISLFLSNQITLALDIAGTIDATHPLWEKLQHKNNLNNTDVLLKTNTKIIHGEHPFHLYARRLDVETGAKIIAFEHPARNGKNGSAGVIGTGERGERGKTGKRGLNAGQVTIEAVEANGKLTINNQGQNGGHGGNGGNGATGAASYDCIRITEKCEKISRTKLVYTHCDPKTCAERQWHCPTPAGQGGNAGKGGQGGAGGDINIQIKKLNSLCLALNLRSGINGKPGKPGTGGKAHQACREGLTGKAQKPAKTRNQAGTLKPDNLLTFTQTEQDWIKQNPNLEQYINELDKRWHQLKTFGFETGPQFASETVQKTDDANYPALKKWRNNKDKFPYSVFDPAQYGNADNNTAKDFFRRLNSENAKKAPGWTSQSYRMLLKIRKQWLEYQRNRRTDADVQQTRQRAYQERKRAHEIKARLCTQAQVNNY
jgi:hypothetical protein